MKKTIYTIDAETDPFDGTYNIKPFIWDIYDGKTHFTMESVKDCHHFIEAHPGTYFAHNGGKFDFMLDNFTAPIETGSEVLIINGRLAKFHMLGSEFRDSFCILPSPLSEIGGKLDIDYAKLHRSVRKKHMTEIIAYLHGDTEALHRAVVRFRSEYGHGITLAGCAIKQLQKILKIKKMPRLYESTDRKIRGDKSTSGYYYGGRVEAFVKGIIRDPFTLYDIVSAYPAAMLETHCWGEHTHTDVPKIKDTIKKQSFYHILAESKGAFPVRNREGIHFPHGKGEFKVTGWELDTALKCRLVKVTKIISRITFLEERSFKGYIDHFFAMKASAAKGSPERLHAKLFLNSAYGKLGCDPRGYRTYKVVDPGEVVDPGDDVASHPGEVVDPGDDVASHTDCGYTQSGWLGGRPLMSTPLDKDEWRFIHVGAAASVTGFVRAKLMAQISKLQKKGGKVLYCDTDSIAVAGATIKTSDKIGGWSLDSECVEGAVAGKKMYAFKRKEGTFPKAESPWKISSKGVRFDASQIYRVAKGETVDYHPLAPSFGPKSQTPRIISRKVKRT